MTGFIKGMALLAERGKSSRSSEGRVSAVLRSVVDELIEEMEFFVRVGESRLTTAIGCMF